MFKQLYVYLVLFTMLLMTVGGGISIFMGVADYVSPNTYSQTFTEYKTNNITYDKNGDEVKSNKSDQELREEYNQSLKDEEVRAKNDAKHQIISSLGFIVIPFPIFLYFNRQRKKDFPKAA